MKLGRVKFNDNLLVVVKIASDNHLVVSEIIAITEQSNK